MFIVKKVINGKNYFYLRESKRENGRVVAKTIAYLGKTKEEAEKRFKEIKSEMEKAKMEKVNSDKDKQKSNEISIEEMAKFCRRKGFVYPSGELYGGLAGFWDFGPLGVELKNNIKKVWWDFHVHQREDIVGIDGAIISNPKIWEASGHLDNFIDIAVVCKKCGTEAKINKHELGKARCEKCGGEYEVKKEFNPIFVTQVGPIEDSSIKAYLRPETAQMIFSNFKFVQENARLKLPFGIAQIGKAFRNEIAPRNFLFRSREFEQMEIEYFVDPAKKNECKWIKEFEDFELNIYSAEMQEKGEGFKRMKIKDALKKGIIKLSWHAYWLATEVKWFLDLGVDENKLRVRQHLSDEKSHYATDTWDIEYHFPFGWKELEGIADRGCYDLSQHEKFSKKDLKIFDEEGKKKILPEVVAEPSLGVERAFLVFMFDAYEYDEKRQNIVLKLNPKLSPVKAAVLPLVKNDEKLVKIAREIYDELKKEWNVIYDSSGSIGRRYSRNDEIGTPMAIAVDNQTLKDKSVTIRDRDTTKQVRVKIKDLKNVIREVIGGESLFKFGKLVETRVKQF